MSTFEDRLAALEQSAVTRTEFTKVVDGLTKAMRDLTWQVRHTLDERNQEMTISLGILSENVRVLKEDVTSLKVRMSDGFSDLNRELYSMNEKFEKRFVAVDKRLDTIDTRFVAVDKRLDTIDTRFVAVDKRFDAIDERFVAVDKRFDAMEERFEKRFAAIDERFFAIDKRFDAMEERFEKRFDSMEGTLAQILARLP